MSVKKNDLRRCLLQKFEFEEVPGSKHEAVSLFVDNKKVATTRFSRCGKDISDSLLGLIAREIWVQLGYLKEMYCCTKSREDYLQHLQNNKRT